MDNEGEWSMDDGSYHLWIFQAWTWHLFPIYICILSDISFTLIFILFLYINLLVMLLLALYIAYISLTVCAV